MFIIPLLIMCAVFGFFMIAPIFVLFGGVICVGVAIVGVLALVLLGFPIIAIALLIICALLGFFAITPVLMLLGGVACVGVICVGVAIVGVLVLVLLGYFPTGGI